MSCSSNPVNLKKTKQICKEECSYEFNYSDQSSPTVANVVDYLAINVDSKNTVKFNTIDVTVPKMGSVRIYQPSFHLFAGKQADAEIVIFHSNKNSNDTLLVCIPITERDGKGKSNSFFSQIIPHAKPNSEDKTAVNVNVSNWSLNNIVPSAPFYFYIDVWPFAPCTTISNIIVFELRHAATINSDDLKKLQLLITPLDYTKKQKLGMVKPKNAQLIMYNKDGSRGPGSEDYGYYIFGDCEAITGMGDDITVIPSKKIDKNASFLYIFLIILGIIILCSILVNTGAITQIWKLTGTAVGTKAST
jgi:carbonic anhydrase